jgi:VWFA-related protein
MLIRLREKGSGSRSLPKLAWFLGIVCLALSPMSQSTSSSAQSRSSFNMRVDVELTTTEVAVLDKSGQPVRNLKKENFRLYEDGKQQEITIFDEITAEVPGTTSQIAIEDDNLGRGKTVLIIFDDSSILPLHLKSARDSAARFVREHMNPQDLFAVAVFDVSLKIFQNFTNDRNKVLETIAKPASSSADSMRSQSSTTATSMGGSIANRASGYRTEELLRALRFLNVSIERLKGKKSVLLYSESSFFDPNSIPTIYNDTLSSAKKSNVIFITIDPAGLSTIGENRQPSGHHEIHAPAQSAQNRDGLQQMFPISFLSKTQNPLSNAMFQGSRGGGGAGGGGTGGGSTGGGSTGGGSTGGGSTGGGSTGGGSTGGGSTGGGSTGGGSTGGGSTGGGSTGGGSTGGSSGSYARPSYQSSTMTDGSNLGFDGSSLSSRQSGQSLLKSLANDSGGSAIYNTNDYDSELDKLNQQMSNYYVLGFQSNNPKHDGAFRKLEIKTDLKGVTLKHQSGYLDRRPIDALASSKQEKSLLDAAASPAAATQLPLIFRASYFYDSPRLVRVMISAKIHMAKVALKKKGSQLGDDLSVMGVAYAEDGNVSARFSETLHLTVDKDKEQDFRKSNIGYRNYFRLRPGRYRLKVVTSDEANNLGSLEQSLELPAMQENGMATSSLVLAERLQGLPDLIRELQAKLLDDSEPLTFSGLQISPSIENRLAVNSPLPVFFKLYNVGGPNRQNLISKAKLLGEKGEAFSLPDAISLDRDTMSRMGDEAVVGLNLPFKGVPSGKYTLVIEISEAGSSRSAKAQTDVEFMPK